MANAKECDRCGKFYRDNTKPSYGVSYWNGVAWNNMKDLCPECEASLEMWYKHPDGLLDRALKEENENA